MTRRARGFTLVELLVVIAIIGILVGLLMPAVEMAREGGRRATCANNVKQLSLACLEHLQKQGYFPSGGWGYLWTGVPDRGFGLEQPGGWIYNILPYIDQAGLHDYADSTKPPAESYRIRLQTPLAVLHCPTRRKAIPYPNKITAGGDSLAYHYQQPHPVYDLDQNLKITKMARNDYAINGGSKHIDHGTGPHNKTDKFILTNPVNWGAFPPVDRKINGLCFVRSQIREGAVTDGMSNTYLLGEKYLSVNDRGRGAAVGDDEHAYSGDDIDLIRWGRNPALHPGEDDDDPLSYTPMSDSTIAALDVVGKLKDRCFGGPHRAGFNMAFCDGSVRLINYGIDLSTHEWLCSRNDHRAIDPSKISSGR